MNFAIKYVELDERCFSLMGMVHVAALKHFHLIKRTNLAIRFHFIFSQSADDKGSEKYVNKWYSLSHNNARFKSTVALLRCRLKKSGNFEFNEHGN